ncbi:hypothetical protein [Tuberibacillus sp. Marseille-P3662]|uniref:hypothetical protein n=1 Tax=Tuberibacillus sp. Marseille-P3662 TaxID=1965358 RepID=UPI00111C2107|nr:hypothetical protein [Tuberibacillus sp. Marseille-P3662]
MSASFLSLLLIYICIGVIYSLMLLKTATYTASSEGFKWVSLISITFFWFPLALISMLVIPVVRWSDQSP